MSKIETGVPAFPTDCNKNILYGMDLRDYFAAKAMQGSVASGMRITEYERASFSYKMADAMMEARK